VIFSNLGGAICIAPSISDSKLIIREPTCSGDEVRTDHPSIQFKECVLSVSLHEIQWGAGLSLVIQKEEEDSR
jgi:hypothetical protein